MVRLCSHVVAFFGLLLLKWIILIILASEDMFWGFKWQRSGFSLVFREILSVFFVGIVTHVCGWVWS